MSNAQLDACPVIAETVATSCRILGVLGVSYESLGHVSYRPEGRDFVYIKGKGPADRGLRYATAEDVLRVGFDGEILDGAEGLQVPSEIFLHLSLYQRRPELRSVIHVHPEFAVVLTACEKPIVPMLGAFGRAARLAIEGVPTYPRSITISNRQLGAEFAEFVGGKSAVLMRGHGATVSGDSVEDATVRALTLNQLARMTYMAHVLGTPRPIPDADLEALQRPRRGVAGMGSARGKQGLLVVWRHYVALEAELRGTAELRGP